MPGIQSLTPSPVPGGGEIQRGPGNRPVSGVNRRQKTEAILGYLLLVPAALFLALVIGYPLLRSVQLSLSRYKLIEGIDSERFCGLCNFGAVLRDPYLTTYLKNQAIWVVGATLLPVLAGLALALLMNRKLILQWFWRSVVLIPWMMPIATSALSWRWIYDREWGILNYYLQSSGLVSESVGFLTDRSWLWPSIIIVGMWMWFPYNYVAILAALQGIPKEMYEAATVDGSTSWTEFWYITLPSIRPVLSLLFILGVIWSMNDFTTIFLLTEGGPGIDSTTLAPLVYKTSFRYYDLGKGAAIGMVLMLISLLFAAFYLRQANAEEA
jgi:multiple sugar transport system permease protein